MSPSSPDEQPTQASPQRAAPELFGVDMLRALRQAEVFPDPASAEPDGLLALGGNYQPEILLAAYARGIFPWPNEELPYAWFCPDPRCVLRPGEVHVPRRLARTLRQGRFTLTFDRAFTQVVAGCAQAPRPGQPGTWITEELATGFEQLHQLGLAHSVDVWQDGELAGGLYGLSLGNMFAAESMFHNVRDASKVALVILMRQLEAWGFHYLDCQFLTPHLETLGAIEQGRASFLRDLEAALQQPTRPGPWTLELGLAEGV